MNFSGEDWSRPDHNFREQTEMKLAQFKTRNSDEQRLGLLVGEAICDVAELARAAKRGGGDVSSSWLLDANDTLEVIERGASGLEDIEALLTGGPRSGRGMATAYVIDAIDFLPAVYPKKILAIGRNYADHATEGGAELPKAPLLFNKLPNALSAHNAPIVLPAISPQVDYEAELAVIIGRTAKRVSESEGPGLCFG